MAYLKKYEQLSRNLARLEQKVGAAAWGLTGANQGHTWAPRRNIARALPIEQRTPANKKFFGLEASLKKKKENLQRFIEKATQHVVEEGGWRAQLLPPIRRGEAAINHRSSNRRAIMELANESGNYQNIISKRRVQIMNKIELVRTATNKNQKVMRARNARAAIAHAEKLQMFNTNNFSRQLNNAVKQKIPSPQRTPSPKRNSPPRAPSPRRPSAWREGLTPEQLARQTEITNPRSRAYVHPLPPNRNRSSFI